ncbi:MAG: hypothetical protein IKX21_03480 [Deltaproteobacteria bacterium]|nr:hypothetical protein [Deltaproteobacteria bacterium]
MTAVHESVRAMERGGTRKNDVRLLICAALTLFCVLSLFHDLQHYQAHENCGWIPELLALAAMVATGISAVRFVKRKAWMALAAAVVCLAVSAAVFFIARSIPVCVECQHLTKADLGWLNRWIWAPD